MRQVEYRTTHVPAFLTKLWKLVTDSSTDDLISWSASGSSFIIYDEIRFSKELLPMYFKHNNMASFVRQLNMYGFRKLSCIEQNGMHCLKSEIEFYHHFFIKSQESMLELIKRKIPSNRTSEESKIKPEYVKELIGSIKYLQARQQNSDEGMKNLRKENKLLWTQFSLLNNRYMKQQAMLQQVLPIFMNMVESNHRLPPSKRRLPLMFHEGEKETEIKRNEPAYVIEHADSDLSSDFTPSPGNTSNRGPVIHDVTEGECSNVFADDILCTMNAPTENDGIVDSPLSSLGSSEHTMDGSFAETSPLVPTGTTMEPLNVLNCNFASAPYGHSGLPLVKNKKMVRRGPYVATRYGSGDQLLLQRQLSMSSQPDLGPGVVPMQPNYAGTSTMGVNPNLPYNIQAMGGSSVEETVMSILNETSNLPPSPANSRAGPSQGPGMGNILNCSPGTGIASDDQYLDYWLGQVFNDDNLTFGASLPTKNR